MIQDFANWLVYKMLEFTPHTQLGEAVNFFVYDTVKILFLLYAISLIMGVVNAYFPVERIRVFLITRKLYGLQSVRSHDAILFLFLHSLVHRICEGWHSLGGDVCLPDYVSFG